MSEPMIMSIISTVCITVVGIIVAVIFLMKGADGRSLIDKIFDQKAAESGAANSSPNSNSNNGTNTNTNTNTNTGTSDTTTTTTNKPSPQGSTPGTNSASTSKGNTLKEGQKLGLNEFLTSANGKFTLIFQKDDGNIVIYDSAKSPKWASGKTGPIPDHLIMQTDGNVVAYDTKKAVMWASGTNGKGSSPYAMTIKDDGSLVITGNNASIGVINDQNSAAIGAIGV